MYGFRERCACCLFFAERERYRAEKFVCIRSTQTIFFRFVAATGAEWNCTINISFSTMAVAHMFNGERY